MRFRFIFPNMRFYKIFQTPNLHRQFLTHTLFTNYISFHNLKLAYLNIFSLVRYSAALCLILCITWPLYATYSAPTCCSCVSSFLQYGSFQNTGLSILSLQIPFCDFVQKSFKKFCSSLIFNRLKSSEKFFKCDLSFGKISG